MSDMACNQGCFICGPSGEARNHIDTGCCHSTLCDPPAWKRQVARWLKVEKEACEHWLKAEQLWGMKLNLWLAAERKYADQVVTWLEEEERFIAALAAKPRHRVRYVTREEQHQKDPARQRAQARVR